MDQEKINRVVVYRLGQPPYYPELADEVWGEMRLDGYDISVEAIQNIIRELEQGVRKPTGLVRRIRRE